MKRALYFTLTLLCLLSSSITVFSQNMDQNQGDVNLDGEVNIADVNALIDVILSDVTNTRADVNGDGEVNIADVNALIDIILGGGIDPHLLEICGQVSEIDQVLTNYYCQCGTIDELEEYTDEIEAIDGVEYVFFDQTTMFVKIEDFGTISYSYFPKDEISYTAIRELNSNNRFESRAETQFIRNNNEASVLIVNQQSKDESRSDYALLYEEIKDIFLQAGFVNTRIENSPSVEFYRNGLFDNDFVFLITHGVYEFNEIENYLHPGQYQGTHWLMTSEEVPRVSVALGLTTKVDKKKLAELLKGYDTQDVNFGTVTEERNGSNTTISYLKVSEYFINSSEKQFKHPGKAIVFNTACQSMKGPHPQALDSINYSLARVFQNKGAGAYFGYDETNSIGKCGGMAFYGRLLSGMTINDARDDLQEVIRHEHMTEGMTKYWADLVMLSTPEFKQTVILSPTIALNDLSDDNSIMIDLQAGAVLAYYTVNETPDGMVISALLDEDDYRTLPFKYGFELSESESFTDLIPLNEKCVGEAGCTWDSNTTSLEYSEFLSYQNGQTDSKIKPNTTYWARVYIHDGQGYNYSDPITFTTGTVVDETPQTETFMVKGVSFSMVPVEGGTFTMGDTNGDGSNDERPTHQVALSSFKIGQTEVTQALWEAVMGDNPSYFNSDSSNPVEQITWHDCQQFIFELNKLTGRHFRLPTDAEYEFASRGGVKSNNYKYSGSNDINDVAWYNGNSNNRTHPVASKLPNELGLYDMSGNVWEWCQDWFGNYSNENQTNPAGPEEGSDRVMRSGSYDFGDYFCRVAHRNYDSPSRTSPHLGMRLVLDDAFSLSVNAVDLTVGEDATVLILNGSGQYSVTGAESIVDVQIQGNQLMLSGKSVGSARLYVSDLIKGVKTTLLVNVTLNKTFTVNGVSFSMVPVEGGTFSMGASSNDTEANSNEKPAHQVTLSSYYMGQTEVTRGLWLAVMGGRPDDYWGLDKPKVFVTWLECQTFIAKLNELTGKQFRLPTEAEWEFAARGGNKSMGYKYSGSNNIDDVAWYRENAWYADVSGYRPVATKAPNELGLYDMTGNVEEWVNDWYGVYGSSAQSNPAGPSSGTYRVTRGGSFISYAEDCRVTLRHGYMVSYSGEIVGFRLAL